MPSRVWRTAITHDVFDGAAEQFRVGGHDRVAALDELDRAPPTLGLEGGVLDDLVNNTEEMDRLAHRLRGPALQASEHQELTDQRVQPFGFPLDAIEGALVLAGLLARQTERDVEPGERQAQLVRDVAQQPTFGGHERIQPLRHPVEVTSELGELVGAVAHGGADAHGEVALGQGTGGAAKDSQRASHVVGEGIARDGRRRQDGQQPKHLRHRSVVQEPHEAHRHRGDQDVAPPVAHHHRARLHRGLAIRLDLGLARRHRALGDLERLGRNGAARDVAATRIQQQRVNRRRPLEVGPEAGDTRRALAIEDGDGFFRAGIEDGVTEARDAHLDRRRGGGNRQLRASATSTKALQNQRRILTKTPCNLSLRRWRGRACRDSRRRAGS